MVQSSIFIDMYFFSILGDYTILNLVPCGCPQWLSTKESACDAGDVGSVPGLGRSPGGGNGHPLSYSCLEDPMDRGTWRAAVCGVTESDMTK